MDQQIEEWMRFCEGQEEFERHHFDTLFMEGRSEADLERICQYFPNSDKLLRNLVRVIDGEYEPVDDLRSRLIELARLHADQMRDLVQSANYAADDDDLAALVSELASFLMTAPVRFFEDADTFDQLREESKNSQLLSSIIGYFIAKSLDGQKDDWKSFDLYGSFYFISHDLALQSTLGMHLIDPEPSVSLDRYLDIYCIGGEVGLSENEIMVTSRQ